MIAALCARMTFDAVSRLPKIDEDLRNADESHVRTREDLRRQDAEALMKAREMLDLFDDPDDDAPTLLADRRAVNAALDLAEARSVERVMPIPLVHRRPSEQEWLASLPAGTRRRLALASAPLPPWPRSNRPLGAVSAPVRKIPSLDAMDSEARGSARV